MAVPQLTPAFIGKVRSPAGLLSVANTTRDGSAGTFVDLFAADTTFGSLVEKIYFVSAGAIAVAPSDNVIRMYRKTGAVYRLIREFSTKTITPSATLGGPSSGTVTPLLPAAGQTQVNDPSVIVNVKLAPGDTLSFSIHTVAGTQDNYHVHAEGGDYASL